MKKATWYFKNGKLSNSTKSWKAVSGPWGPRLPKGRYVIGKATALVNLSSNASYKDKSGNVWWCPLEPAFATTRTSLGIHPDGGKYRGTRGCIGLTADNTQSAFFSSKKCKRAGIKS